MPFMKCVQLCAVCTQILQAGNTVFPLSFELCSDLYPLSGDEFYDQGEYH